MKLQINVSDKDDTNIQDVAIANAYGKKFIIPLYFGSPAKPRGITMEYQSKVLRDRQIPVNKSDTTWSCSFNATCRSLKSILV